MSSQQKQQIQILSIFINIIHQRINLMNKNKLSKQKNIDKLLHNLINSSIFSVSLSNLIQIDTTCLPTLRQIHIETIDDFSKNGIKLNSNANKLINIIGKVKYGCQAYRESKIISEQDQSLQSELISNRCQDQRRYRSSNNNENFNSSNYATNVKPVTINLIERFNQIKNSNRQIIEITRPEYRRDFKLKTQQSHHTFIDDLASQKDENIKINKITYTKIQKEKQKNAASCLQQNQIPLLKKYSQKNVKMLSNISPKVERKKIKIETGKISPISRNLQTQTDISFQIDLSNIHIVNQSESDRDKQSQTSRRRIKENTYNKANSNFITEQQPWECDEQELEEQLRVINDRLSHRLYQTPRIHNEMVVVCEQQNTNLEVQQVEHKKKQTKTIRLSLTPLKTKSKSNHKLKQVKKQIVKTPIREKKQLVKKEIRNAKQYQIDSFVEEQLDNHDDFVGKWNRQKRGLISVQIKNASKNI